MGENREKVLEAVWSLIHKMERATAKDDLHTIDREVLEQLELEAYMLLYDITRWL